MSKICDLCGKVPSTGNAIERRGLAKKKGGVGRKVTGKTKRRYLPNLQHIRIVLNGRVRYANVCTRCISAGHVIKASVRPKPPKPAVAPAAAPSA